MNLWALVYAPLRIVGEVTEAIFFRRLQPIVEKAKEVGISERWSERDHTCE